MKDINALALQELVGKEKKVGIPWLRGELELSYGEARQLAQLLRRRGWLGEETPTGYLVNKQYLLLRRLCREEVDDLIESISEDAVTALELLKKNQAKGADFKQLESKVRGDNDTQSAIDLLQRNRLTYEYGGVYFLRVSGRTVDVLKVVQRRKRMLDSDDTEAMDRLRRLFNPLF